MKSDFLIAVTQLAAERGLPKDKVLAAVEAALLSVYRKDTIAAGHDIQVRLDPGTGEVTVYALMTVVEQVADPKKEITLDEARKLKPDCHIGDTIEQKANFLAAGRIAAQTAKQVVLQRLRDAERELLLAEFLNKVGDILPGRLERLESSVGWVVSLGRAEGVLPREEQVPTDRYRAGQTMQFYLVEVRQSPRGPELVLSRTHKNLLKRLFEREVPEIFNGIVEIKAIAREPGSRSKVAVAARQEGVDPVGSCVGLRGFRIQAIVQELQGEKIDVIQWHKDLAVFIGNALSPAQPVQVMLDEAAKTGTVVVPDKQLSLAIGKEGQNARLAARLTGWKIDIESLTDYELAKTAAEAVAATTVKEEVASVAAEAPEEQPAPEPEPAPVAQAAAPPPKAEEAAPAPEKAVAPEEVALEELLAPADQQQAPEEEAPQPEVEELPADIWELPKIVKQPSVLRFAEDIMPERARSKGKEREDDRRGKAKKAKRHAAQPGAAPEE